MRLGIYTYHLVVELVARRAKNDYICIAKT